MIYVEENRLIIKQQNEIDIPFQEISYLRIRHSIDYKANLFFAFCGVVCAAVFIFYLDHIFVLVTGLCMLALSLFIKKEIATLDISTLKKEKIYATIKTRDVHEVKKIIMTYNQYSRNLAL